MSRQVVKQPIKSNKELLGNITQWTCLYIPHQTNETQLRNLGNMEGLVTKR